ncbi:MAG: NDP-hexose 4-ketoreductase [Chloroflexi bacterium]|nr:NDP-hexose 4-ketoreductase [Chloroflexota bacterium]|tara:strand:- start:2702 stop:5194 length:2493 start_codon:yes stop_codon:yes gene_type:complete
MTSRFEKFSERARRVLSLAQEEAKRFNHTHIDTEHILLGLLKEKEGVAATVLVNLGVDLSKAITAVEFIISKRDKSGSGEIGLTPRAKKVIELAVDEARRLNHNYIGTEHLLIGLLREGEGVAAGVLESLQVNLDNLREQTERVLEEVFQQSQSVSSSYSTQNTGSKTKTPTLDQLGVDLTKAAKSNKLDPTIGRKMEIKRVIQILSRRTKNNPVLIGEPGVGKTAIVEGLAQKIASGNVPRTLNGKRLISLDMGSLVAGTKYRGEFEERLKKIVDEIRNSKDCVLFIDEIHTMVGAGAAEGAVDAANILKPSLARGDIQTIGATTLDDYRKHMERDPALERRFQPVRVEQPNLTETIEILKGIRPRYEEHHELSISDDALSAAANMASRFISDRFLPDKAIDLIDEASSRVRIDSTALPENIQKLFLELEEIKHNKDGAISNKDYELAARLRDDESDLQKKYDSLNNDWNEKLNNNKPVVGEESIAEIVSMWTGIPVTRLATEESERLVNMEESLKNQVVGQDDAIHVISKAVRRSRAGLKSHKRPMGMFMFLGPTGVGKTYLVQKLAEFMFGSEDDMIRIDMSEFMERHSVSRLIGAPPGYIGHEEGGQLTEAVRRKSYRVILLDEIEKAHQEVFNILLQIFDDGHLTDSKGRKVDFRNTIIVMTSNIGSDLIRQDQGIGFSLVDESVDSNTDAYIKIKRNVLDEVKKFFKPEFLNRIDALEVFKSLTRENMNIIVDLMLSEVSINLVEKGIDMEVTQAAKDWLADSGFDIKFGARPLRRVIQNNIEDNLSDSLLKGELKPGDTALIDLDDDGQISITPRSSLPIASA